MLICDKRRPRTRGDTNIRPPQGGRIKTAPPASGPRLGRSLAGGLHPQNPPGCAPWCAFAPRAPAALVPQPEWFRARVRPVAGVVNRLRLSTLDAQPLPLSPGFSFSKARQPERGQAAGLSTGGRQSLQRRRWADPGTARRAAVHLGWAAGLSTAKAGHRAERQRHPAPGSRPPQALRPM